MRGGRKREQEREGSPPFSEAGAGSPRGLHTTGGDPLGEPFSVGRSERINVNAALHFPRAAMLPVLVALAQGFAAFAFVFILVAVVGSGADKALSKDFPWQL